MDYTTQHIENTTVYIAAIDGDEERLRLLVNAAALASVDGIKSLSRRLEKLTTWALVLEVFGKNAVIGHNDIGAPFIMGRSEKISISHCADKVVLAVNPCGIIGVDAELWRPQLLRIKGKFLSHEEQSQICSNTELLRAWTIKEAVYKAALTPGLSLSGGIALPHDGVECATAIIGEEEIKFKVYEIEMAPESAITLVSREGRID